MSEIIPAIMPKKFSDIEWSIDQVRGRVKIVQLDIMDGKFVKNISWPFGAGDQETFDKILGEEQGLPDWEHLDYELDLMIADPAASFENLMKLSPKRVVVHIESLTDPKVFFETIDPYFKDHVEIGIALNTTTAIEKIAPIISEIKFVQCMGIEKIGYQGQPFDERVLDQIAALRKAYPALTISVDGAVNLDTAPALLDAGANRLVIGSAIFESGDVLGALQEFKSL